MVGGKNKELCRGLTKIWGPSNIQISNKYLKLRKQIQKVNSNIGIIRLFDIVKAVGIDEEIRYNNKK